jgi:hypothetical protein
MIESPMVKELIRDERLQTIRRILDRRFGSEARSLQASLDSIANLKKLEELVASSTTAPQLESFKKQLRSGRNRK